MKRSVFIGAMLLTGAAQAMPYGPGPSYGYTYPVPQGDPAYYYGVPQAAQPAEQNPAQVLRDGVNKLLGFLKQTPRPGNEQVAKFLTDEIAGYFDFAHMARFAAGPVARSMEPEQMQKLEARLREMFLGAMAQHLSGYADQSVEFLPPRRGGHRGDEVTLPMAVRGPQGYPSELDFRLYLGDDGWKVFDVVANGSSALMFYRNYFRDTMRRGSPGPRMGPAPY
jgi:phospholipid transport system substrate-binding protein